MCSKCDRLYALRILPADRQQRGRRWYNAILLCFLLSLCIEVSQLVFKVGSFDVDDLLLNTLGGALGYMINRIVQKIRIRRKLNARTQV